MMLKPIRGQIIVKPDPPAKQIGAIFVPEVIPDDNPNWFTETGTVVALAPYSFTDDGEERRPFDLEVGQRVHFGRFAGKEVFWERERLLFMREQDVRAIVEGDAQVFHGYEAAQDAGVETFKTDPLADRM
jgi:chaperonin GroES